MIFGTALSGINAASTALQVTGNNIANANTTGFKSSSANFGDVYAVAYNGISAQQPGEGVRVQDIAQNFSQGTVTNTGNNLDMAINGLGFFALDNNGSRVYSRAGAFHVDRNGDVVNPNNDKLLVFGAVNNSGTTTYNTASPQPLNVTGSQGAPKATSQINASLNLDATSTPVNTTTYPKIDPTNPASYTYSTAGTVYDSLGASHTLTLYFRNDGATTGGNGNKWTVQGIVSDGAKSVNIFPSPSTQSLTFNSSGQLTTPNNGILKASAMSLSNGATLTPTLNLTGTTQYGGANAVNSLTQDGYSTGRLSQLSISSDGVVTANYTNGQSKPLGQVALANFTNPNGLQKLGNTTWGQTYDSGQAQLGAPGTSSFGQLQAGSLESSNVNLPQQLVNLITEQRNYQANAKVITTGNTITQTILQM